MLSGVWKCLRVGGLLDGEERPLGDGTVPRGAINISDPLSETDKDGYRCVGYVERQAANVLIFVCDETTMGDLDSYGLIGDLFIKKFQAFQLFP